MADRIVTQVKLRPPLPSLAKHTPQKRVAAYARVSTDSDEQMNSVEAQKDYFQKLISEHSDWVLVDIYADEGISGTSTNRREAFNRMINDALDGKIDMILTKSLSRFARNTVDTLNTIRKLKSVGVGVYFEKEDIDTLDAKGEFLITLMSSLAEEESRSISENVKWGQRKRFADGKYTLPYKQFLGYKKGSDSTPELVEDEAKIIRIIYRLFLEGYSTTAIAKKLSDAGIPSPAGKPTWQRATVDSILQNEKYYGAALLQKQYTVDFRTKKKAPNNGELPKYYIEHDHEPIVTKEIYDEVQRRLKKPYTKHSTKLIFSHKLVCADCGGLFGPIRAHSTTYNDIVWKCRNRHLHKSGCTTPSLYEELLKPIFHEVILTVLNQHPSIIRDCVAALNVTKESSTQISTKIIWDAVINHTPNNEPEYRIWRSIIDKVIVHPGHLLEFHITDGTVITHQMTKTAPRSSRLSQAAKDEILSEYANGTSATAIAHKLNIPFGTVRSLLHRTYGYTPPHTTTCQCCGVEFHYSGNKDRKYCRRECYRGKRTMKH